MSQQRAHKLSSSKTKNQSSSSSSTASSSKKVASSSTTPTPMETDQIFTDYKLVAGYDPTIKNNILKFAPSSKKEINLETFIQPVKLNRRDPWAIRKKIEEEKKGLNDLKLKSENPVKGEDDEMKIDPDQKPSTGAAAADQKQQPAKLSRDDSLVAPAPASQPKVKHQPFKKKTKQVFISADQTARMLKREEYQSWLLEDGSTGGERWIGRFESAGAGTGNLSSGASGSSSASRPQSYEASNYVIFRLDHNGADFQVLPCHRFYRFTHCPSYDTLGAEEAQIAYEKMQKPTTKEDVGRWFMRRRGVNAGAGSASVSKPDSGSLNANADLKREGSVKPHVFDESKISFGSSTGRPQVEAVSVFGGRKGKFTAVHGSETIRGLGDDDEDVKPRLGQDGDFDEVDYNEEFADDEEGAGNLNDEAMEEDELRELEERLKREMLAAGKAGDDEKDKVDLMADKDDLFGERDDLDKDGKALKKLLVRKVDNDVYASDDEQKNPYVSEEEESDFEEVIPPPLTVNGSPPDPNSTPTNPNSRAGTPVPGSINSSNTQSSRNNLGKLSLNNRNPTNSIKLGENPKSGPPSRSGTPGFSSGQQGRAISPRPVNGSSNNNNSSNTFNFINKSSSSRASSPPTLSKPSHSGNQASSPTSPNLNPSNLNKASSPNSVTGTPSGAKRKHPGGGPIKEKRQNQGSRLGSPLNMTTREQSPVGGAGGSRAMNSPENSSVGLITEEEVVKILKLRSISTKELLAHFKMKMKEGRNRDALLEITRKVATIINGLLVLKDG